MINFPVEKIEQNVLEAFVALTAALDKLSHFIRQDSNKIAWVHGASEQGMTATMIREKIITVLNQLHYMPDQLPREIVICAGFIGASSETIEVAHQVNACKALFKQHILQLRSNKISIHQLLLRSPIISKTLKNLGLSRLHLKQCYRKIPILKKFPNKISWTWAHTRSIKKISIDTAHALLLKRGDDPGIHIQIQKLGTLPPQESLAIVQELAPHLRANIVFEQPEGTKRIMIKGPVPIFFPAKDHDAYPKFTIPQDKKEKNAARLIRSDLKLDPCVFLPAIRAHRYHQIISNDAPSHQGSNLRNGIKKIDKVKIT